MAERRPAGFNVPLGFYDGPEVNSIQRRIRAAAVGVWTLCGTYSANKLQDGYVGPETLKQLGCTAAIRSALMGTKGSDGESDPLWIDARGAGIQFTKWVKYQRSRDEVKAYRNADAERKRNERKDTKPKPTLDDSEMSGRTSDGRPPDYRDPKTKTETRDKTSTHLSSDQTYESQLDSRAATPGADLVRQNIPNDLPSATRTMLRIKASALINEGTPADVVGEALRDWATKTGVGPGVLPSLAADVVKRRNGHTKPSKLRGLAQLAHQEREREQAQLAGLREIQ